MILSFAGRQRIRQVTLCKQVETSNLRDWADFSLNGQHCLFLSLLLLFVPFARLPPPTRWWPEEQSDGRGYCRCCLGRWPHNANVALRIWPSSDPPTGGQPLSSKWPGSNVNRWVADSQHTTTTIAPPDSVIARPRNPNPRIRIVPTFWCLRWSDPEIEGWPGRVSLARSASTGQSPFGGRLAGGCALNSAPPMAAASGGAGKGVRGFSAWWEGPLWATSTLWLLPFNTSTHFFTPAWETTGSAGLSRWSLQKPKTDEATSALPNGYYAFIDNQWPPSYIAKQCQKTLQKCQECCFLYYRTYCSFLKKWFDIVLFIHTVHVCEFIHEDLNNQLSRIHSFPGKLTLEKIYIY